MIKKPRALIVRTERGKKLQISAKGKTILAEDIFKLKKSWQSTEVF
jgi:hypothetical protein